MKLTKQMREAFVNRVMSDVPTDEMRKLEDEIRKMIEDDVLSRCPKQVQEMWADRNLRYHLATTWVSVTAGHITVTVPVHGNRTHPARTGDAISNTVLNMAIRLEAMRAKFKELRERLHAVAMSCTTTQALAKALPEFEKYIPKDAAVDRSLPVVANVVADFVKAGWPKGKQPEKEAA